MSCCEDKSLLKSTLFITFLLLLLCYAIITGHNPVSKVIVRGESMESTLYDSERGLVLSFGAIQRYCIIVFSARIDGEQSLLVKRVIGMPGDRVECRSKTVYVNGEPIVEFAKNPADNTDFGAVIVPDDCYFVLGDNRAVSMDSRYTEVGFVSRATVRGIFKALD